LAGRRICISGLAPRADLLFKVRGHSGVRIGGQADAVDAPPAAPLLLPALQGAFGSKLCMQGTINRER
jgi:hypothetical protein